MELKRFFVYYLDLIIIIMLLIYITFSFQNLSIPAFPENNSFLYLGENNNLSYQFYENMRFKNSKISFLIKDCNTFQENYFKEALFILENNTFLEFYEVKENAELELFCEDWLVKEGNFIIAGEGGPVLVKKSGDFYIIEKAQALLRKESKCSSPNTALHEILHGFGFVHSLNPSNIMYKHSYCGQKLSQDILDKINEIYTIPPYADLKLKEGFFKLEKNILNFNITIENKGLDISEENFLNLFVNDKLFKEFGIPKINYGESLNFYVQNLYISEEINSLVLEIDSFEEDLNFENNKIVLI